MVGDVRRVGLQRLAAGKLSPERQRSEPIVPHQRGEQHQAGKRHRQARPAPRDKCGAENARADEPWDCPRRVVEVDRRLGRGRRQEIDRELGGRDERQRGEDAEQRERQDELGQVAEAPLVEGDGEEPAGIGHSGLEDPARRAADLVVAAVERGGSAFVEVGGHDPDRDRCHSDSRHGDDRSGHPAPPREGVPTSERSDDERDLLLAQARRRCEDREGEEPVLVEVPDREQEEGSGQGDGMELVQRQPLDGRVEQIRKREAQCGPLGPEVLAR